MAINTKNAFIWSLFAFILFIAMRVPFLHQPLIGEEGNFAMIVTGYDGPIMPSTKVGLAGEIDRNCLLVIGHIDVQGDSLTRPGRNITPYCFLGMVIKPIASKFNNQDLDFDEKSSLIRIIFLLLSSLGFISLCALAFLVAKALPSTQIFIPYLVLIYFTTNHLAIGSSIQPQLDGAFGFLLLSNVALLAYLGSRESAGPRQKFFLNFIAGFLIAFCKNEWPLTLLVSICLLYLLMLALKLLISFGVTKKTFVIGKEAYLITAGLLFGCLSGIGVCYLFSPADYLAGFGLMQGIHGSRSSHLKIFFKSLYFNIQILTPILVVLLMGIWAMIKNWRSLLKNQVGLLIIYLWSWGVLVGFLQSGWGGDGFPRYYFPPLLMGGAFLITQIPSMLNSIKIRQYQKHFTVILFTAIALNYGYVAKKFLHHESLTVPGNYVEVKESIIGAANINQRDPFGIVVHQSAMRYYFPKVNFIAIDIGKDGALQWPLPSKKYYLVL